jgi:hypothetical protein
MATDRKKECSCDSRKIEVQPDESGSRRSAFSTAQSPVGEAMQLLESVRQIRGIEALIVLGSRSGGKSRFNELRNFQLDVSFLEQFSATMPEFKRIDGGVWSRPPSLQLPKYVLNSGMYLLPL